VASVRSPCMPSRLIYVGMTSALSFVHLTSTPTMTPTTQYMTLSHRWGFSTFLRLLESNIESMMTGIQWSELPLVFQEAITITRSLGIRYIWVDSLCIVQDSIKDWTREAGNMTNVYRNSFCNIAATSSEGDDRCCFWERDLSIFKDIQHICCTLRLLLGGQSRAS